MNLLDVTIIEVLSPPVQKITEELCCWEVKVRTECYGIKGTKIFRAISKTAIEKYKKGYTWKE